MSPIRITDVVDEDGFALIPPCADPRFDHRTCDYWEDADRGSKAARPSWLESAPVEPPPRRRPANPFAASDDESAFNPFAPSGQDAGFNPFLADAEPVDNPFAPEPKVRPGVAPGAPRKLTLLGRGLAVFGSYAKVLLVDDVPAAWSQFGPLSA